MFREWLPPIISGLQQGLHYVSDFNLAEVNLAEVNLAEVNLPGTNT